MKILITEPLADEGVELLRREYQVDVREGIEPQALAGIIGDYDALIVRSATKVDEELLEKAGNLKVVGRAGIGVDNVDVDAATRRGIVVVNAPGANNLSNAEHTMALMLALVRQIPGADASLRAGAWEKNRFVGSELHGKTLGIVGLGRTGVLVAQRANAFGMRVIASDPYMTKARAAQIGVELLNHDDLYREADFISIHVHKTTETTGMIGERELGLMKPLARIINTARGGIIDEEALVRALEEGRVAGAAVDVFDKEPPGPSPLLKLPNVVATPHIGGSTEEAQRKAGESIAEQVLLVLSGELAPYAVNVEAGTEFVEALRPYIGLTEKLGRVLTGIGGAGISSLQFEYLGTLAENDTRVLTLAGLKGVFSNVVNEPVTFVNAPLMASERGVEVKETKSSRSPDYIDLIVVRAESDEGPLAVGGTLVGKRQQERIVRIYDYELDMEPARYMCFLRYQDRPGIIGEVGTVLGTAGINIASMHVSRETIGGEALMGLTVDSPLPTDVLGGIARSISARDTKFIDLEP